MSSQATQHTSEPHPPAEGNALVDTAQATTPGSKAASLEPVRVRLINRLVGGSTAKLRFALDSIFTAAGIGIALIGAGRAELGTDGVVLVWLLLPVAITLLATRHAYEDRPRLRVTEGPEFVVGSMSVAAALLIAVAAFADTNTDTALLLARAWAFSTLTVLGGRLLLAWTQRRARVNGLVASRTLVVGAGQVGTQVERRLREQPQLGYKVIGFLDGDPPPADMVPSRRAPVLGAPGDLERIIEEQSIDHVVLAFTTKPDSSFYPLIRHCEATGVAVTLVPRLFESINVRVRLDHVGGLPLLSLNSLDPQGWQFAVKHLLDRIVAALLLIISSPVFVVAAILVWISSPGPILFKQLRMGRDGRSFEMLKFRSMRPSDAPDLPDDWLAIDAAVDIGPGGVEGDDRRTAVGRFLRTTSLDELPQLINVLKGEISLVGPRPERPEFVELFEDQIHRYDDRLRVKAGMTGWAQVHGLRGKTSLGDRVEWDNYYIENWSLGLDLKILAMTMLAIFHQAE